MFPLQNETACGALPHFVEDPTESGWTALSYVTSQRVLALQMTPKVVAWQQAAWNRL